MRRRREKKEMRGKTYSVTDWDLGFAVVPVLGGPGGVVQLPRGLRGVSHVVNG